jgi:uncharacterized membrane protein
MSLVTAVAAWGELFAALATFLLGHAIPARQQIRAGLIRLLGRPAYLIVYSILSIIILGWLIAATASAPFVELWQREDWQATVPAVGMAVAITLALFGLSSPNPLSLSARRPEDFDPARPGIAGLVRHPVLWATLLWSTTHIVPNGDLAHLIMFGLFTLLSVGGMVMLDRRKRRVLGDDNWQRLARMTSNWPLLGLGKGWRPAFGARTALRLASGIVIYAALVGAHDAITGVPLL